LRKRRESGVGGNGCAAGLHKINSKQEEYLFADQGKRGKKWGGKPPCTSSPVDVQKKEKKKGGTTRQKINLATAKKQKKGGSQREPTSSEVDSYRSSHTGKDMKCDRDKLKMVARTTGLAAFEKKKSELFERSMSRKAPWGKEAYEQFKNVNCPSAWGWACKERRIPRNCEEATDQPGPAILGEP